MKIFLLLALSAGFIMALEHDEKAYDWEEFKVKYNRNYSPEEEQERKALFDQNVELTKESIEAFNKKEIDFHVLINNSSDYTMEERDFEIDVEYVPRHEE